MDFGLIGLNQHSATQSVTITNPGPDAASISSIYATNGFSQTNDCPTSLAVSASCTVSVDITPTQVQTSSPRRPTCSALNNVVTITISSTTVSNLRLHISNNDVQGAPQIAEFEVYSN